MRNWLIALLAGTAVVVALVGCRGKQSVNVVGSTSMQELADDLKKEFRRQNADIRVQVQGGGSTAGVQAIRDGTAEIGACSRSLTADEAKDFDCTEIALDGLAIIVHPSNPVKELTTEQVQQLFSGQITNWKDVGGDDAAVHLVVREAASGTREAFMHLVMQHGGRKVMPSDRVLVKNANGTVRVAVRNDPGAVGYMSLGLVGTEVRALRIDGAEPTVESIVAGKYRLYRPFLFATRKGKPLSADADRFLKFALSDGGQKVVVSHGLISVKVKQAGPAASAK